MRFKAGDVVRIKKEGLIRNWSGCNLNELCGSLYTLTDDDARNLNNNNTFYPYNNKYWVNVKPEDIELVESNIILEKDGIKVGDKVIYQGHSGYVAVIDPSEMVSKGMYYMLRLDNFEGSEFEYYWNNDWYPESEKKKEKNCCWLKKGEFFVKDKFVKDRTSEYSFPNADVELTSIFHKGFNTDGYTTLSTTMYSSAPSITIGSTEMTGEDFKLFKELTNKKGKKTMLQEISDTLKRILSKDMRAQYRAGYRNGDLALTSEGKSALLEILAQEYEVKLADSARALIKRLKAQEKGEEDEE